MNIEIVPPPPFSPPECKRKAECRLVHHGACTTLLLPSQFVDGHGNPITDDPNIITERVECHTCNRDWRRRTQFGKTKWTVQNW